MAPAKAGAVLLWSRPTVLCECLRVEPRRGNGHGESRGRYLHRRADSASFCLPGAGYVRRFLHEHFNTS